MLMARPQRQEFLAALRRTQSQEMVSLQRECCLGAKTGEATRPYPPADLSAVS